MTLDRLMELSCEHFGVTKEEFLDKDRGNESISIARHCFRALAYTKYAKPKVNIARFENKTNQPISNSCDLILKKGVFKKEFEDFKNFVDGKTPSQIEIVVNKDGIERITNDAFDERFYKHPKRINPRTGKPYFPAFHFILDEGLPIPRPLIKWYKQMGFTADQILERSKEIGSFVHDAVDRMVKYESEISNDEIFTIFKDSREALFVRECLWGFMNFIEDEEPQILSSERMECGEDFGFTIDNEFRIKSDKYKHVWASDWKTSSSVYKSHEIQVVAIMKTVEADRCMVIRLGTSSKRKYTIHKVKIKDYDYLWDLFLSAKETAYIEILHNDRTEPRKDQLPSSFSLKDLKYKKKL